MEPYTVQGLAKIEGEFLKTSFELKQLLIKKLNMDNFQHLSKAYVVTPH